MEAEIDPVLGPTVIVNMTDYLRLDKTRGG